MNKFSKKTPTTNKDQLINESRDLFNKITGVFLLGISCATVLFTIFLYLQLGISGNLTSSISRVIYG